jgi:transposase-like protein
MNESIMKTDRRGRLRYTPEQKKTMIEAYQASGLSAPRFAAHHGVNYQTLVSWIKKGKMAVTAGPPGLPCPAFLSLVPAELEAAGDGRAVEVLLPGGAKLVITAPGQVQLAVALIRALENPRSC